MSPRSDHETNPIYGGVQSRSCLANHQKGYSAPDASSHLVVPVGLLSTWASKLKGVNEQPIEDIKALRVEMTKLITELRRTTEERDILKKSAAYFAKLSEWSTRLSKSIAASLGWAACAEF